MSDGVGMVSGFAGTAMLLLALALPCAEAPRTAVRLGMGHAAALGLAAAMEGAAGARPVLLALAALVLGKALALPWLLPDAGHVPAGRRRWPLAALGSVLAGLPWIALPPVAGLRPATVPLALGMLVLGLVPALWGQPAPRRLLGLLVAANGVVLAALGVPGGAPLLLELGALGLLGALALAGRREPGVSRAVS